MRRRTRNVHTKTEGISAPVARVDLNNVAIALEAEGEVVLLRGTTDFLEHTGMIVWNYNGPYEEETYD